MGGFGLGLGILGLLDEIGVLRADAGHGIPAGHELLERRRVEEHVEDARLALAIDVGHAVGQLSLDVGQGGFRVIDAHLGVFDRLNGGLMGGSGLVVGDERIVDLLLQNIELGGKLVVLSLLIGKIAFESLRLGIEIVGLRAVRETRERHAQRGEAGELDEISAGEIPDRAYRAWFGHGGNAPVSFRRVSYSTREASATRMHELLRPLKDQPMIAAMSRNAQFRHERRMLFLKPYRDSMRATTASICSSGVEAPAVTPTASTPSNQVGSISSSVSMW